MKQINQIGFLFSLFITCLSHAMLPDLHQAVLEGNFERVEELLDAGISANIATTCGYTPLHVAARNGYKSIVWLLLERGAYVNATTPAGYTPLKVAEEFNHTEVANLLRCCPKRRNLIIRRAYNFRENSKKHWPVQQLVLQESVQQEVQSNSSWLNNVWFQSKAVATGIADLIILKYQLFKQKKYQLVKREDNERIHERNQSNIFFAFAIN